MAWTYDTSLTTDKDKIRLYIGDTIDTIPLLSDEEIQAALDLDASGLFSTAESLCRALSARFGREAEIETASVKDRKVKQAEHFLVLAEKYAAKANSVTEIIFSGQLDADGNSVEPFFTRDMHLDGTIVTRD